MNDKRTETLLLPIALALAGALFNSHKFLVVACAVSLIVYLFLIYDLLERGQGYRFFLIASLSCAVWATLGFLQSASYMEKSNITSFTSIFAGLFVQIDVRDYSLAFAYLYFFVLFANFISGNPFLQRIEINFYSRVLNCFNLVRPSAWTAALAILSGFLMVISFLNLLAVRGLSDQFSSIDGALPWWYSLLTSGISLLPLLLAMVLLTIRSLYPFSLLVALFAIFTGLYLASLKGRFAVIMFVFSTLYCLLLFVRPSEIFRKIGFIRLALIIIIASIAIPVALKLLAFLNVARGDRGLAVNPISFVASFLEFLASDQAEFATEQLEGNLASRPLILWPLAASIKMTFLEINRGYILFQDIFNSFLNSLPGPLFPFKANLLLQEKLLYKYFPFSNIDTADSPALYAFTSFNAAGIILYPLFIATAYTAFLRLSMYFSQLYHSIVWVPAIITLSTLTNFAIASYAELSTTGLLRGFIAPLAMVIIWSVVSQIISSPKGSNTLSTP